MRKPFARWMVLLALVAASGCSSGQEGTGSETRVGKGSTEAEIGEPEIKEEPAPAKPGGP